MHGVGGEITDFVRIDFQVIQFLSGAGRSEDARLEFIQFSVGVQLAERLDDRLAVLVTVVLQMRQVGQEVADILEALGSDTALNFHRFIATVAG